MIFGLNMKFKMFKEIIEELDTSHIGGGIFEVTKDNLHIFEKFSNWFINVKYLVK